MVISERGCILEDSKELFDPIISRSRSRRPSISDSDLLSSTGSRHLRAFESKPPNGFGKVVFLMFKGLMNAAEGFNDLNPFSFGAIDAIDLVELDPRTLPEKKPHIKKGPSRRSARHTRPQWRRKPRQYGSQDHTNHFVQATGV